MLQYRCKACLLAIIQLAAISGTFSRAPYFIEEPSDIYVKKGRPAELHCRVGGTPKPSIIWKRNDNNLDLTSDSRRGITANGSLYFSEIIHNKTQKPDEGIYQCAASSRIQGFDHKVLSRTARVIVAGISSKVSVISPYSRKVPLGDTSRFFCSVKHSAPKAVISWRKKGENGTISSGKHYTLIPNGALQIRNIRFEEGGDYECIAENLFTNKRHTSTDTGFIEVLPDTGFSRRPRVEVKPKDTVAVLGSEVVLECIANGSPKPRVTWLKNGSPVWLGKDYSILGESNLMIKSVTVAHAGNYTCRAVADFRKEEASAKLEVHYTPVFSMKPSDVHAHSGSDVRFKCSAHGIPKPTITWSKNGVGVGGDYIVVGDGFMLVKDLVFWDAAVYQCFAENYLGKVQASANLFVYRKGERLPTTTAPPTTTQATTVRQTTTTPTPKPRVPEKPENVVAIARSDTEILLTWEPPKATNGEIQHYRIFYSVFNPSDDGIQFKPVSTPGDQLKKSFPGLIPDTKYRFNVFAVNEAGAGAISDEVTASTYPSSQVPGKPQNLVAEAESDSSIRVTWSEPDTGPSSVLRYHIMYKKAGTNGEMHESTKQQTRVLRYLDTYTKYIIEVYAVNKREMAGAKATTEATTKGGVPRVPPTDFVLKPDSTGKGLIATWKAPDPTKVNGRVSFYKIIFRKVGSKVENTTEDIPADKETYTIEDLMPSTRYEAIIAAGTDSGIGEYTKDWVRASTNVSKCEEDTTPGKPTFKKAKVLSTTILVSWKPPDNSGLVCVSSYEIRWGENTPFQYDPRRLKGDQTEYLIKGLKPNKNYVILLIAINSKGNGPDVQTNLQTLSGIEDTKPVKIVEAVSSDPREMQLSWKDEQASSSVPITYHVYHSLRKQLTYCGNTTDKKIKCSRLKPCTEYTFYVRRNDEQVNASISSLTSEDKPGPPTDLTGNPDEENSTQLTLHWQPPKEPNGNITKYRIFYSTDPNTPVKDWKSVLVDGSKLTEKFTGLEPGTTYYFEMQARTKKGWGRHSKRKEAATLTKSLKTEPSVATELKSPSSPDSAALAGQGKLKNKTLWIVIAAVAGITLIAIIIISVILCKKRSGDDIRRKPPTYKSVIQANGSTKKKSKEEKSPDLWINHTENFDMKPVQTVDPAPDVTNITASIPRSTGEMKPLDDSPLDHIKIDQDRSSFMNGSEADCEEFDDLPPPPPKIDSAGNPYVEYPEDSRTSTPPPSPGMSPLYPPLRASTPDNVYQPMYPKAPTPRYQMHLPRTGSCENNSLDVGDPRPPQRSRSYDPDFRAPSAKVPVFPKLHTSPPPTSPKPKAKPPVAPADDIQLPPVGFNRKTPPNGYWTPPPKYEEIFARRSNPPLSPPSSPPRDQAPEVSELDKEIAGLEGLMRDLNEITAGDYQI